MPHVALVTARAARDLDEDLPPLVAAFGETGAKFAVVDWDDATTDWSAFDVAVLRSTWDYTDRLAEFLDWAKRVAMQTTLRNPVDVVRWNTDKHYLAHLERASVPIVPSSFVEPGESARDALDAFLTKIDGEFVVKPCVGAGSRDAQRYGHEERAQAIPHVERLLAAKRSVLLQPYLNRVDEHGETSLLFFDGVFSHAIRKGPLLRRGEDSTRALFAAEHITPRTPSAEEVALARRTLAAIPFAETLLYARVDLIHADDGSPRVLELELTEPSLFFAHGAGSAQRFAAAILAHA
ncbi:MAG: ATP-grasp domain-containing protein [Rhodanobacteraceae bacterium]